MGRSGAASTTGLGRSTTAGLAGELPPRIALEATAKDVFDGIRDGTVRVEVRHTYRLSEAEQAHRDLEGRRTVGSVVLRP